MSVLYDIKQIHNISRPGDIPAPGDVVEIECVGGFILEVDPKTRRCSDTREHKQFIYGAGGRLSPKGRTR